MARSSTSVRLAAGILALAVGCSEQSIDAPRLAAGSKNADASASAGRYVVLAKGNGFSDQFGDAVATLGGTLESIHNGSGVAVVSGLSASGATTLATRSDVADLEADQIITLTSPVPAAEADVSTVMDPSTSSVANPATAARYTWQWNMRAIHADAAWAAGKLGDAGVTVAIIDTGIDYDAPDLNGLVDLSRSTSFIPGDNTIRSTYFASRNDISDFNGHGTNVATQVSSRAVALAGVTSRTTLIGVKVLAQNGSGPFSAILNGVLWAADHGADVANMSLGGEFAKAGNGRFLGLINRVFNYASRHGMLIVVAAGNDGADLDHNGNTVNTYCNMPQVVCVAATGPATASGLNTAAVDAPSYFTNIGRSAISVAAPGGNADAANGFALSAWPWATDIASWVWSYCSKTRIAGFSGTGVPILTACVAGNRISGFIGTSQASPHVAGLAALLVSVRGHGQPQQIKQAIEASADDLGQPGVDPFYGRGRINVARALGLQ